MSESSRYIPYYMALGLLDKRLKTTPEELSAWIFLGPKLGGIAAYCNADELDPPPRFHFNCFENGSYLALLMATWFLEEDITNFKPSDRFITGKELLDRWDKCPGIKPSDFIITKIQGSRLLGFHPMTGVVGNDDGPTIESSLFSMSEITAIEEMNRIIPCSDQMKKNHSNSNHAAEKPWLTPNPGDPSPEYEWYTPARYFARKLLLEDSTLLIKRDLLARKVADSLKNAGIHKRGGKKPFNPATVKKAFSNVEWS